MPLLLEILGNICITIVCFSVCAVINFETNLIFVIKAFFYMAQKSRQKSWDRKELLMWRSKRYFPLFLRGFQFPSFSQTWECVFKSNIIQVKSRTFKNYQHKKTDKQLLEILQSLQKELTSIEYLNKIITVMYQANLKQNLGQSNSFNLMILFYHKKKWH